MENAASASSFQPVSQGDRIQALDVVRGFALFGIFLMNIEWFNRPSVELGMGLPADVSGLNWFAGWMVQLLVTGKFWTIFSFLFGVGFAVMLTRAEQTGRPFLRPYLRRVAALAVFGTAHHILLWSGDILFSYAVGALALLILLYGKWKPFLGVLLLLVLSGIVFRKEVLFGTAANGAILGLAALYLRTERQVSLRNHRLTVFAAWYLGVAGVVLLGAGVAWILPKVPMMGKLSITVVGMALLVTGLLANRFHDPNPLRLRHLGVYIYLFPFLLMTTFGVIQMVLPRPTPAQTQKASTSERQDWRVAQQEESRKETRVMTQGTYREAVVYRTGRFLNHAANESGFAVVLVGMFSLGVWCVRSGLIHQLEARRELLARVAWIGTSVGVGLSLISLFLHSRAHPDFNMGLFQAANGLRMLGNLPASLGYISAVVLLLQHRFFGPRVALLAPVGRMALTTYLTQSLICGLVFYGYGLGKWGLGRAWQMLFVIVIFALQVALAHRWLRTFRYGPMEWLWRVITYWTWPPLKRESSKLAAPLSTSPLI